MELSQKSSPSKKFSISVIKQMEVKASEGAKKKNLNVEGKALWLMSPENAIRKYSTSIVAHNHFDNTILFLIVFSTCMLILESPLNDPKST